MINTKYDYKPLKRVDTDKGRRYIVGESSALPSVTTILSALKDMSFLIEWKKNVGKEKAAQITAESSGLGTGMHNNLENYVLDKPMTGSFMAKTLAKVIIDNGLSKVDEVWGTEVSLYSSGLYAGTTDLIGLHMGIPSIMDYKNSLKEKKKEWIDDYFMQLTAYSLAHNEMFGTNIHRGVLMIATRDAKYQEFIIEGEEFTKYELMWANKVYEYYQKFAS
jgi:genome maintenance exonuclease 1